MVFCNIDSQVFSEIYDMVTILILVDGFLQYEAGDFINYESFKVTILILVDGFLQFILTRF